jgi:predicted metal-dependent peptidase
MTQTQEFVSPAELVSHFRMMSHQYFPYLSPYVYSLVPVERPGLGTMAVDMQGRMYYDPAFCEKVTLNQGAYVVLHEAWHLILRHCHRAEDIIGKSPTAMERRWYNIAVDLVVWELMEAIAEHAPPGGVTWEGMKAKYPRLQRNMLPAEIYAIIREEFESKEPEQGGHKTDGKQPSRQRQEEEQDDKQDKEQGPGQPAEESDEGEEAEGGSDVRPDPQDEGQDNDGRSEPKSTGGDQEGDGKGGGPGDQGSAEGDSSGPGEGEVEDDGFDLIGGGSAADGIPRDYEEEPNPNWDAFIEDQLLEAVEKKVEEQERDWKYGRGTIPGCLKETIRRKLRPQPNPWESLRATVAMAATNPRGAKDYTYQRINRRQFAMPSAPRLKGSQKFAPNAVVIIDTSGSMTTQCKVKCLQVVAQGLQAVGQFPVICGDTRVQSDSKVAALKEEFEMPGGGGTDMRVLIEYAEKKYKPNVIVIGTDGGTPWPNKPTKAQLIIALTQELPTPPWATRVRIPDDPKKTEL